LVNVKKYFAAASICILLLLFGCNEGSGIGYEIIYPECSIIICNESDITVTEIYLVETSSSGWSENLLTQPLEPGENVLVVRPKGIFKMRVVHETDIITEITDIDASALETCTLLIS